MKRVTFVGLFMLSAVGLASHAAEPPPLRFPLDGVVTGNNVYVRSGPDTRWYPLARLMKGARVRVMGEDYGWFKIEPPPHSFSWVLKEHVEKVGAGEGKVSARSAPVRAGSVIDENNRRCIQVLLADRAELKIIGERDKWYKVKPPDGAYVWISARYVAPAKLKPSPAKTIKPPSAASRPTTQQARARGEKAPSTQPTAPRAKDVKPGPTDEKARLFGPFAEKIAELDKQFRDQAGKSFQQRRWREISDP